jgi:F-type H+-transporting ATPase subunit epsilon
VRNDRVIVLSDVAELASDIDTSRAQAAKARAEEALSTNADDEEAQAALKRAEVRLEVAVG